MAARRITLAVMTITTQYSDFIANCRLDGSERILGGFKRLSGVTGSERFKAVLVYFAIPLDMPEF